MRILDVRQGTEEWLTARAGIPTASACDKLVTPARLQPSKQLHNYACKLAAERMLGRPLDDDAGSSWTNRGTELEDEARKAFAFEFDVDPVQVGFCVTDDGLAGCSPDFLLPDLNQGGEIKCPSAAIHIGYLMHEGVPKDYLGQCQFSLFVTEYELWNFWSYCPGMPPCHRVVYPDTKYQAAIGAAVGRLGKAVEEIIGKLRAQGCVPASERPKVTSFAAAEGVDPDAAAALFD